MNYKILCLFIFLYLGSHFALYAQQESQFTQYIYNQQFFNPAYSGIRKVPTLYALHRTQWMGYPGAPQHTLLGFNSTLINEKVGVGLLLSQQRIGISKYWQGALSYAYELPITPGQSIRLGIQGSMKQLEIDFTDPAVIALEGGDPVVMQNLISSHHLTNWGAGTYYLFPRGFLGIAVPNWRANEIRIGQQAGRININKESPHHYFIAGYTLPINQNLSLLPTLLLKYVKNAPPNWDIGARINLQNKVSGGLNYRTGRGSYGESLGLNLLYMIRKLEIGLAYDIILSSLTNSSSGSCEIFIRNTFWVEKEPTEPNIFITLF